MDWIWRRAGPRLWHYLMSMLLWVRSRLAVLAGRVQAQVHRLTVRYLGQPHTHDSSEQGLFARSWPIGTTALWIAALLSAYVLVYYS